MTERKQTNVRVIFKDEDIMPGGVIVGPVTIIDLVNGDQQVDGGAWKTIAEAEQIAAKHNVTLEQT